MLATLAEIGGGIFGTLFELAASFRTGGEPRPLQGGDPAPSAILDPYLGTQSANGYTSARDYPRCATHTLGGVAALLYLDDVRGDVFRRIGRHLSSSFVRQMASSCC